MGDPQSGRPILVRWLALALAASLPPGLSLFGIGGLWALVLWQEGKAGIGVAAGMSVIALSVMVILYAGF